MGMEKKRIGTGLGGNGKSNSGGQTQSGDRLTHPPSTVDPNDFNLLLDYWNQRLAKDGFVDIESSNACFTNVKHNPYKPKFIDIDAAQSLVRSDQEYYRIAGLTYWNLYEECKLTESHEKVLFDYCQGLTHRQLKLTHRISWRQLYKLLNYFELEMHKYIELETGAGIG